MTRRSGPNLTEDRRCLILADYLDGVPLKTIAQRHDVCVSCATTMARRSGFPPRHVEGSEAAKARHAKNAARDWLYVSTKRKM